MQPLGSVGTGPGSDQARGSFDYRINVLPSFRLYEDSVPPNDYWDLDKLTFLQMVNEYATLYHLVVYNPKHLPKDLKGCRLAGTLSKQVQPQEFVEEAINNSLCGCISAELRNDTIELKPPTKEGIKRVQAWREWRKKHP